MEKRIEVNIHWFRNLFILILCYPYFYLLFSHWPSWDLPQETGRVFVFTFTQAFLSALASLLLGFFAALGGVLGPSSRSEVKWNLIALAPNFMPVIVVLISVMSFFYWLGISLQGLLGIVVVHVLINMGLVAWILAQRIKDQAMDILELAYIEGAKGLQWIFPLVTLLKKDLLSVFIFVFFICFSSFSVPLILGNGLQTTLEVFIYEQIKIYKNWGVVQSILIIELILLFAISTLGWGKQPVLRPQLREIHLWKLAYLKYFVLIPFVIIFSAWLVESLKGWMKIKQLQDFTLEILHSLPWTFLIVILVLLWTALWILGILWLYPAKKLGKFLFGIGTPSTVLVGYSLSGRGGDFSPLQSSILISLALALIFMPALYRLFISQPLKSLRDQVFVAQSLGGSRNLIFIRILLPQLLPQMTSALQLVAFWACGEFALSSLIAKQSFTLPLIIKYLMQSYHLSMAAFLLWGVFVVGLISYFSLRALEKIAAKQMLQKL